jgi:hypothetical protein
LRVFRHASFMETKRYGLLVLPEHRSQGQAEKHHERCHDLDAGVVRGVPTGACRYWLQCGQGRRYGHRLFPEKRGRFGKNAQSSLTTYGRAFLSKVVMTLRAPGSIRPFNTKKPARQAWQGFMSDRRSEGAGAARPVKGVRRPSLLPRPGRPVRPTDSCRRLVPCRGARRPCRRLAGPPCSPARRPSLSSSGWQ